MALTKRSVKGSALTHTEMDANLTHLGGDGTYVMPTTDVIVDKSCLQMVKVKFHLQH